MVDGSVLEKSPHVSLSLFRLTWGAQREFKHLSCSEDIVNLAQMIVFAHRGTSLVTIATFKEWERLLSTSTARSKLRDALLHVLGVPETLLPLVSGLLMMAAGNPPSALPAPPEGPVWSCAAGPSQCRTMVAAACRTSILQRLCLLRGPPKCLSTWL